MGTTGTSPGGPSAYLEAWVPRMLPYELDLVREAALRPGERVLVVGAGRGSQVLAAARAVGGGGVVRATDDRPEMVRMCREQAARARLAALVECAQGDAVDVGGGPWDAVLCAFGSPDPASRVEVLRVWRDALAPGGRVGVVAWGPGEPAQPFARFRECLRQTDPAIDQAHAARDPSAHRGGEATDREALAALFGEAGLVMVRHAVVRHTMSFASAEAFVRAMHEAYDGRPLRQELGGVRFERAARLFYEAFGGPDAPLSFDPPATLAIAGLPPRDRPGAVTPG
ncbi:MAG TPA: methyltransferase domain-containing protein [Polyangiaceae bacterium]|nr:methyltransferase domain-containing protein [Polyangiaceae bacterium]